MTNHEVSVKVANTNHESCGRKPSRHRDVCSKVRDKPVCVALMEFSLLQCTGKVGDKVHGDFVVDTNHENP